MTAGDRDRAPRILVVEDEQIVAADLQRTLTDLGYETATLAATGRAALRVAEHERPDLVLMDIRLRGAMDGVAAAKEIYDRWQIPIVFVTANTNDEVLSRARDMGPYGYLIKPFRARELNATILVSLYQHRRAQRLFWEQAWLRNMLDNLTDCVLAVNGDGRISYLNPAAERITGWPAAEALARPVRETLRLTALKGGVPVKSQIESALESASPVAKERYLLRARNGREIPIEGSASPIVEGGAVTGAVSVFTDITDRLRREQEAEARRDSLREKVQATSEALGQTRAELRALSGRLMAAQEEERRRVARELHDDFCQKTAALEMDVTRALNEVPRESAIEELLQKMRQGISDLGAGLRTVSHGLHPSALEDIGLVAGLRGLVRDFEHGGNYIRLSAPDAVDVTLETATALYRIAQEALRNAARHAAGSPVTVILAEMADWVELSIEDAGPGFDLPHARIKGGLGLLSMQERARSIGGLMFLRTRPGDGVSISVRAPRGVCSSDAE